MTFTRQRIRWTKDPQSGPYIEASQEKAIEVLEEIPDERNTEEDLHNTPAVHTRNRSLLGQINWFQSMTQFQCCYTISRCASRAVSPTIGDEKSSSQAGDTSQVEASETSVLATHKTDENNWIA